MTTNECMSTVKKPSIALSPGKLILSGEHSVVVGQPALAVAIEPYCSVSACQSQQNRVDYSAQLPHSLHSGAKKLLDDLIHQLSSRFDQHISVHITIDSALPIGCGLGSSAALISACLLVICQEIGEYLDKNELFQLAQALEHNVHQRSSGLDVRVVQQGGGCYFQHGKADRIELPELALYLVDTGTPLSTTGDCVLQSQKILQNQEISQQFGKVTEHMKQSLLLPNHDRLHDLIRENHFLLRQLGVVPQPVADFIDRLWEAGIAAKISGAGSILGDAGGIVMALGDEKHIYNIAQPMGYNVQKAKISQKGAHCVLH